VVVTDDGQGFEPGAEGFGLRGMRERVELIGGSVTLHSDLGRGTRLVAAVPRRAVT
jgi:two-component system sensor histidine kinase DegS